MSDATLRQSGKVVEIVEIFEDTPRKQLQALLASGLLADLRDGNIAEINRDEFRKSIGLLPLNLPLLEELGTVVVPATDSPFVARERYGHKAKPGVRISYLGDNFREWFLGKTEEPTGETELRYAKLVKSSVDGPILAELGDKAETTLAQIYHLTLQSKGEEGVLLTNEWANIFYCRDVNGSLRVMFVACRDYDWRVRADSVENPNRWHDGHRVFSRNS